MGAWIDLDQGLAWSKRLSYRVLNNNNAHITSSIDPAPPKSHPHPIPTSTIKCTGQRRIQGHFRVSLVARLAWFPATRGRSAIDQTRRDGGSTGSFHRRGAAEAAGAAAVAAARGGGLAAAAAKQQRQQNTATAGAGSGGGGGCMPGVAAVGQHHACLPGRLVPRCVRASVRPSVPSIAYASCCETSGCIHVPIDRHDVHAYIHHTSHTGPRRPRASFSQAQQRQQHQQQGTAGAGAAGAGLAAWGGGLPSVSRLPLMRMMSTAAVGSKRDVEADAASASSPSGACV